MTLYSILWFGCINLSSWDYNQIETFSYASNPNRLRACVYAARCGRINARENFHFEVILLNGIVKLYIGKLN